MKLVLFDVDGTLLDSQHLIHACLVETFKGMGRPPLPRAEMLSIVGLSLVPAIQRLFGDDTSADDIEKAAGFYREAFLARVNDPAFAPPLFPAHMFRSPLGSEDPVQANAHNPDYDGAGVSTTQGLPPIAPLEDWTLLNGGLEVELLRYARFGERVQVQSRYVDILEKETRSGPMVLVIQENEYRTEAGELLMRVKRTHIRRPR